jgi:hypothetical protein
MSRSIRDLLPDVRVNAAGVPEFLALHALTRSLGEFLDRSEAWREWLPVLPTAQFLTGLAHWPNHLDDDTQRWARIRRIDKMQWYPTGSPVDFKTASQLQEIDPQWRTRTGSKVLFAVNEGEFAAPDADHVSEFQVRVYPIPMTGVDPTFGIQPRVVVTTDVVSDMDLDAFDGQVPTVPDRIFYSFREAIVAGALANLFMMPGKDFSNPKLAVYHRNVFESSIVRAQSRANAEFGHPTFTTSYGGL